MSYLRVIKRLALILCIAGLTSSTARAGEESQEFWPELNVFKKLTPATRLYLAGSYAKGKESFARTYDGGAYVDVTLKPLLRPSVLSEDWKSKKYFWARVGYVRVAKAEEEGAKLKPAEDRLVAALLSRWYLPGSGFVEARARTDFRRIGGDYSTRYRVRLEMNRDYNVRGRVWTPYIQIESFYDTRYDGWSRMLYQPGVEIELTDHFRVEPYVARQVDRLPEESTIHAAGLVAKWYY